MPDYSYEALDKGGRHVKGAIEASSEDVIIDKLRDMGYYPLNVSLRRAKATNRDISAAPGLRWLFHRIKPSHIATFTRQLATLIAAGLPIMRALAILQMQVPTVLFKRKVARIAEDIEQGNMLSDALAKHPKVFDSTYVNMVRAGEIGGALEAILMKIADYLEKRQEMMAKIRSAVMYPIIVLFMAVMIVGFILLVVMPHFKVIYDQLGAELPWLTQMLIDVSSLLATHTLWVVVGIAAVVWCMRRLYATREGKYLIDRLMLKVWVFGELQRKIAIARFADTFATLISAGVPVLQVIDIVRETSGNAVVSRAVAEVYESVREGNTIHEPLSRCEVFPPLVVQMVAVGEEVGAIDQMLQKVAEAYERDVDLTISALTSLLEPILIVLLGIMIGVVVVALYLPMFQLVNAVK